MTYNDMLRDLAAVSVTRTTRIREIERMPKPQLARLHVQQGGLMGYATYMQWRKDELVRIVLECEGIDPWTA